MYLVIRTTRREDNTSLSVCRDIIPRDVIARQISENLKRDHFLRSLKLAIIVIHAVLLIPAINHVYIETIGIYQSRYFAAIYLEYESRNDRKQRI